MEDSPPLFAVLFRCDPSLIADSIHALAVDALAAGVRVIGASVDDVLMAVAPLPVMALSEGGDLVQAHIGSLPPARAAMLTGIGADECCAHAARAERLPWPLVNPALGAARADDKAECHALLAAASVPTPRWWLIRRSEIAIATEVGTGIATEVAPTMEGEGEGGRQVVAALSHGPCYILPNSSTEGRGAERFAPHEARLAIVHARRILDTDDCLVREERGTLRCGSDATGHDLRRLALRVHVAWDGVRFVAESGFAQVAGTAEGYVAGRARGCDIVPIGLALQRLWALSPEGPTPFEVSDAEIAAVRCVCEDAAFALAAGLDGGDTLKLVGLDILPELGERGRLRPVVLEANARPAGLNHSTWLPGEVGLGVTRALWSWVRACPRSGLRRRSPQPLRTVDPVSHTRPSVRPCRRP